MSTVKVNVAENGQSVELFYRDVGQGKPVVLIHGWPVNHAMWEYQMADLPQHGLRVLAYDRRGFGHSSKPGTGYDYDTLADDLKGFLDALDLRDVTLVGFSMGGGEVARYMARHGGARVSSVAFISSVTPYLLKTEGNRDGVDKGVFDEMVNGCKKDKPDFLTIFGKQFFGVNLLQHPVSQATLEWTQSLALQGSNRATIDCIRSFSETDFRADLSKISVPSLVIHGSSDHTVPISASGERTAKALSGSLYKVYDGAPHGLYITHKDELTADLAAFIAL